MKRASKRTISAVEFIDRVIRRDEIGERGETLVKAWSAGAGASLRRQEGGIYDALAFACTRPKKMMISAAMT